jgi:hypothetical protein
LAIFSQLDKTVAELSTVGVGADRHAYTQRAHSLRWIVESANGWWSNYGQLRCSTDRKNTTGTPLCLATVFLIVG